MRLKSYFARAVEDAMAAASQELGPDAMLVNSRRAPLESRHLGEYEVVFATDLPPGEAEAGQIAAQPSSVVDDRLTCEMADLKKELESMRRALQRGAFGSAAMASGSPDFADAHTALIGSELDAGMVREILQAAEQRAKKDGFRRALVEELESRITVAPELGKRDARPRIVALVGPPGSGKTTALVKLAVNYGLACRRPVLLLSIDTYRVAAADQLRSYAAILGVGFQLVDTIAALAQTIEENRGKELIFIDTPGLDGSDMDGSGGLSRFLSSRGDIDTHLAAPAFLKPADLSRVIDRFEVFRPQRLLFTRLDETGSFGPLLFESARTGKPLSFFSTGQRIPEDLEAASKARLIELILTGRRARSSAA